MTKEAVSSWGSQRVREHIVIGERQDRVSDNLAGFVSLAGNEHDIARLHEGDRGTDRLSAVADLLGPRGTRQNFGADCVRFFVRGLSSVTMTMSAFSDAIRPMIGRLPRSRSPPQPKTQMRRPVAKGRQAFERSGERFGLMGIVDHTETAVAPADDFEAAFDALQTAERLEHSRHILAVAMASAAATRAFSTW